MNKENNTGKTPSISEFYHGFSTMDNHDVESMIMKWGNRRGLQGRPKGIPDRLVPVARDLHSSGLGYRSICLILEEEYDLFVDWTTVRRSILGLGCYSQI